jgi:hypothetical protein
MVTVVTVTLSHIFCQQWVINLIKLSVIAYHIERMDACRMCRYVECRDAKQYEVGASKYLRLLALAIVANAI